MRSLVRGAVVVALLAGTCPPVAQGQPALDRVVGRDVFGKPLVITSLTGAAVGALAGASQVPMGFEAALPGEPRTLTIEATGRSLRAVLDAIVAADPRYEWRDDAGVIVVRPAGAWFDRENALHRSLAALRYDNIGGREAVRLVAALLGADFPFSQTIELDDTRRFSLNLPPGSVLDALNGIVRAYGTLAWSLEPWPAPTRVAPGTSPPSPFMVSLVWGAAGRAQGVGVTLDRPIQIPEDLEPPAPLPQQGTGPALDRIVGPKADHQPLILRGAVDVPALAAAAHAPMGVELVLPTEPRVLTTGPGTNVTGMTLRDALAALIALDPRYEWREIDGLVIVRPVSTWTESAHPLLREIGAVHLSAATLQDAVSFLQTLQEPGKRYVPAVQNAGVTVRQLSVDLPAGTLLGLVNAIARAHGAACWIYEELDDRETAFFAGRGHQLSLQAPGGVGMGFAFR
jgi:hypothetical protein